MNMFSRKKLTKKAPVHLIIPFLLFYLVFRVYPMVYGFILSFNEWMGLGPWNYVGIKNYASIFSDEVALTAIYNTLIMGAGSLLISVPAALALALLINSKELIGKTFFRAVFFVPRIVAIAVSAIIFSTLFNTDYGIINYFLKLIGVINESIPWWHDPYWAKTGVIIIRSWIGIPFMMIYFLAGLQNIPKELYEAAKIDGARGFRSFWHITLPLLKPITLFVILIGTVGAFQIFAIPYMITGGGPSRGTLSVIQYMYRYGLNNFKFGLSSAVSMILFVFLGILSYIEFKVGKE